MIRYERIKATLNGEWPDKVRIMLHNFIIKRLFRLLVWVVY